MIGYAIACGSDRTCNERLKQGGKFRRKMSSLIYNLSTGPPLITVGLFPLFENDLTEFTPTLAGIATENSYLYFRIEPKKQNNLRTDAKRTIVQRDV